MTPSGTRVWVMKRIKSASLYALFDWFKDGILSKYDMGKEINRRIKNYKQLI